MSKITAYTALTLPASGDVLPVVDISDTTMASSGTTKKITVAGLAAVDWLNVTWYGADPTGATDSTAAIQAALNAVPVGTGGVGATVYFPPGTYIVSSTLQVITATGHAVRLLGAGRWQSVIKQANGANLDAVLADAAWLGSGTASDGPIDIADLGINGNKANQTGGLGHGIALISFWNDLHDLQIQNTYGDGLLLSANTKSGTKITSTAVQTHVWKVDVYHAGGYGIHVYDATPGSGGQQVTDGFLIDCVIWAPAQDGIRIDDGSGWLVRGCHLFGVPQNGIHIGRAGATRVIGNYVETWGTSSTPGVYGGINLGDGSSTFIADSHPNVIAGNTLFFTGGNAGGTTIQGIRWAVSTAITANLAITGNGLYGDGFFTAIQGTSQASSSVANVALTGNVINNWASTWVPAGTGTTNAAADNCIAANGIPTVKPPSGNYLVTANSGTSGTSAGPWTLGTVYYTPLTVQVSQAFSGLSTNITSAATGGTTPLLIMGLYNDDGTGKPGGSPVSGTQVSLNPVTAGTGNLDVAFGGGNMTLLPGTYWAAWVITSGTALSGQPTMVTLQPLGNMSLDTLGNVSHKGWQSTTTSSASSLPTGISPVQGSGFWPVIGLKAA